MRVIIGVPREIKPQENRVATVPAGVHQLVGAGHTVIVEAGAGLGSGITDAEYAQAGAVLVDGPDRVWGEAELVWKVKEPVAEEYPRLRKGQVVFAYLHLAADAVQTEALRAADVVAVAFETIETEDGRLPGLQPMSEVAGRLAIQAGAHCLEHFQGGRGVLLGGVPGVPAGKVVIIGGGTVGTQSTRMALGLGADVTVLDIDLQRLRWFDQAFAGRVKTLYGSEHTRAAALAEADLVVGAVLVHGARAPQLVRREHLGTMRAGATIVDVAIDQGGCVETMRPTTHADPTFVVDGIVHYGVSNMPGAVPRTSTFALHNATLPYCLAMAERGWEAACTADPALARGLNVVRGEVAYAAVADAHGLSHVPWTAN